MTTVFLLLIAYQLKHFLADYPLQTNRYMLGKFRKDWGFFLPLLAHVWVHAVGTATIALVAGCSWTTAGGLALFDAAVHFVMDRLKAGPRYMGRWKALSAGAWVAANAEASDPAATLSARGAARRLLIGNALFWNALGLDQMVHHLTHYVCIWQILKATGRI